MPSLAMCRWRRQLDLLGTLRLVLAGCTPVGWDLPRSRTDELFRPRPRTRLEGRDKWPKVPQTVAMLKVAECRVQTAVSVRTSRAAPGDLGQCEARTGMPRLF